MNQNAPIVLFVYRRLSTLKETVESLQSNSIAKESELIIFSDAGNTLESLRDVKLVRSYIKTISGFKSIKIVEAQENKGLAKSIIYGVSEVVNQYNSCIVLEDDLVTSPNFLNYMNQALNKFERESKVFSISGYSFDFKHQKIKEDAFFLNRTWTWGWATWADRWNKVDWDMQSYSDFQNDSKLKMEFSKLGSDVNLMLKRQMNGEIDSWGIRFMYHQFKVKGLTIYPKVSKVNNIGFDQFATHTVGIKDRFETITDHSNNIDFLFPEKVEIDLYYQNQFLSKFNLLNRIKNKIKELFLR